MNYFAIPGMQRNITPGDILRVTADVFGVTVAQIMSSSRQQHITLARHAYCAVAVKLTQLPLWKIGRLIKRHHSTVIASRRAAEDLIDTNYNGFADKLNEIERRLK